MRVWVAASLAWPGGARAAADPQETRALHALFDRQLAFQGFVGWRSLRMGVLGGPQSDLSELLQAAGRQAVAQQVLPALRRLRAFVTDEYLPRAPLLGALSGYPDGRLVYDALLTGYRDIAKRIDAELPRLFVELPRAPYGVRAMPAHLGPDRAEYDDARRWMAAGRAGSMPMPRAGARSPSGPWPRWSRTSRCRGIICRSLGARNCETSRPCGELVSATPRSWRDGPCMPRPWARKSGFMTTLTAGLDSCNSSPGVPRGWSSTG
jgi:hypothetical protein